MASWSHARRCTHNAHHLSTDHGFWQNFVMSEDPETLDVSFKFRCASSQRQEWERAARAAKRKLSDWMRLALDLQAAVELEQKPAKGGKKKG